MHTILAYVTDIIFTCTTWITASCLFNLRVFAGLKNHVGGGGGGEAKKPHIFIHTTDIHVISDFLEGSLHNTLSCYQSKGVLCFLSDVCKVEK